MAEYLKITDFGPVVEAEFDDIRPLTVLIGKSGSGKSTIMKVLSLFRWIFKQENLHSYLALSGLNPKPASYNFEELLGVSGIREYVHPGTEIIYRRGLYELSFKNGHFHDDLLINRDDLSLEKICFISDERSVIPDIMNQDFDRRKVTSNYYLQDTIDNFAVALRSIHSLTMEYLGVKFELSKEDNINRYYIKGIDSDYKISFQSASSGIRNVTPLSMIVAYYSHMFNPIIAMNSALVNYSAMADDLANFRPVRNIGDVKAQNIHLLVEEPELSVDPDSQKSLMDFLIRSCFMNKKPYRMSLMLATHSPYIVNYLNLLTRRKEEEKVHIDYNDVDAYLIDGGFNHSLKIDETKIFDARNMSDPLVGIYEEFNSIK